MIVSNSKGKFPTRTRVTTKGRVTIPHAVRKAFGFGAGTELEWLNDRTTGEIIAAPAETIEKVRGNSGRSAMTTEEILALIRDD